MIIGLEQIMAGYFHLAAGNIQCKLKTAPQINVAASDTRVRYDHSKSQTEMDSMPNDTVSPYGKNVQTHVGGLMSGEVGISQSIRIMQETYPHLNAGCLYVDRIDVKINITPTIFIAREHLKTGCMYKAILEHEKKHIAVDRAIVNKYTALIGKALDGAFKKFGYAHGPMTLGVLPKNQKMIQDYSQKIVHVYSERFSAERQKLQQQVDSLAEYERVRISCVGKR